MIDYSNKRVVVIGDIHGCFFEFQDLLNKVSFNYQTDILISIGDLIHKGFYEKEVINLYFSLSDFMILGNHEEKQIRWQNHERLRLTTGKPNPLKKVEGYKDLSELIEKIIDKSLLFHHFKSGDKLFTLVHGGILPKVRSLPDAYKVEEMPKHLRGLYSTMLRTRYVTDDGDMISLGEEKPSDNFWTEYYDGRFGHVIYGHQPFFEGPKLTEYTSGIDLGAVYGGKLCAALISNGIIEYASVDAKMVYYEKD